MITNGKSARNERIKLLATTVNTVGLAFFVIGVVVPLIALLYGADTPTSPYWVHIGVWWLVQAAILHLGARAVLGRIEE